MKRQRFALRYGVGLQTLTWLIKYKKKTKESPPAIIEHESNIFDMFYIPIKPKPGATDKRNSVELRQESATSGSSATSHDLAEKGPLPAQRSISHKEHIEQNGSREDVSFASFSHLNVKKINRKIDCRIIPMVTILYLLSFLDRGRYVLL